MGDEQRYFPFPMEEHRLLLEEEKKRWQEEGGF